MVYKKSQFTKITTNIKQQQKYFQLVKNQVGLIVKTFKRVYIIQNSITIFF